MPEIKGHCPHCGSADLWVSGYVKQEATASISVIVTDSGNYQFSYYDIEAKSVHYTSHDFEHLSSDEVQCNSCYGRSCIDDLKVVLKSPTLKQYREKITGKQMEME